MAPLETFRLTDFSDREVLLLLNDVADAEGWALAEQVAERIDLGTDNPKRSVANRLSWLQRYGAVEREVKRDATGNIRVTRGGKLMFTQRWRLTDMGAALALGRLTAREQRTLDDMGDEKLLILARVMSRRFRTADAVASRMMGREWRYGTAPERADNGSQERA
jgi:hypothetical protein